MSKKCFECDVLIDVKAIVRCDSCKKILCKKCSELSETELRCIALKNRRLTYLCDDCERSLKMIPDVLKKLDDLQNQVINLQLPNRQEENNQADMEERESIIAEIMERQRRATNIIISNIKEASDNSPAKRTEEDKKNVMDILKVINIDLSKIKVFRLGKYSPDKNRLIKVALNDPNDVITVLRNKRKISAPSVRIFGDQTRQQQKYFQSINKQLDDMVANGDETKTIKYVNNKPMIVTKDIHLN